ncbi:MAG: hypothetical protein HC871_10465 [Rhizobiales bacterium]|nr:hypothetical protein [Hyphomicrobiales bacterium]
MTTFESDVVLEVRHLRLDFPTPMRGGRKQGGGVSARSDPRLTAAGPGKLRGLDDVSFTARRAIASD